MLLYKFVSEKTEPHAVLQSCIEGNIMISRIPDLNDPSEKFASVDEFEIKSSLERIINEGCQDEEISNLRCHIELMAKLFPEHNMFDNRLISCIPLLKNVSRETINVLIGKLQSLLQKVNEKIQERIGIFSVSNTFDSFPMWSHYANEAKGFVVEYDNLDICFRGDKTNVFDKFKPIKYCEEKRDSVPFSPSGLEELFFSKLKDWEYEHEYRLVKPLEDCRNDGSKEKFFAKEKYSQYIKSVIVGWNCPGKEFSEIKEIVTKQSDDRIRVVRAIAIGNHVEIQ